MNWSATCAYVWGMTMLVVAAGAVEHRAPAGYSGPDADQAKKPLPIGIETALEVPRGPLLLGSGWVVHYVVSNRGEQAFSITLGGDYRGRRPTNTWLEAVDATGAFASDPLGGTSVGSAGGWSIAPTINPGHEQAITSNPRLYVRIDRPGRWTLRVFQDLGLGPAHADRDPRWAEAVVDVVMPDEAQAAAVLAEHESRIDARSGTMGKRNTIGPDFAAMGFPIYLPLLDARAREGSVLAIEGLAAIRTAAAVEALLGVLERPEVPRPARERPPTKNRGWFAEEHPHAVAFKALRERLRPTEEQRGYAGSGDPVLLATLDVVSTTRLRRVASAALRAPDPAVREAAAGVLERSPEPQEAETLLAALDRAADGSEGNTLYRLLAAWRGLGHQAPAPTSRPAGALIWLDRLRRDQAWRPDGWRELLPALLAHAAPRIRELAVQVLPDDEPERWAPLMVARLADADAQVRWMAIANAWHCRHVSLLPGLSAAMDNERTSSGAAIAIGAIAGREAEVLAWVEQIAEGSGKYAAGYGIQFGWRALTGATLSGGWAGSEQPALPERRAIAARLRAFVTDHRQTLAAGQLTTPADTWPADLLPVNWYMTLPDGSSWPAGRKQD